MIFMLVLTDILLAMRNSFSRDGEVETFTCNAVLFPGA